MSETVIPAHPRTYALFVNANDGEPNPPYVFVAPIIGWVVGAPGGDSFGVHGTPLYQLVSASVQSDYVDTVCGIARAAFWTDEPEEFIVARIAQSLVCDGVERLREALMEPNEWLRAIWPKVVAAVEEVVSYD